MSLEDGHLYTLSFSKVLTTYHIFFLTGAVCASSQETTIDHPPPSWEGITSVALRLGGLSAYLIVKTGKWHGHVVTRRSWVQLNIPRNRGNLSKCICGPEEHDCKGLATPGKRKDVALLYQQGEWFSFLESWQLPRWLFPTADEGRSWNPTVQIVTWETACTGME